MLFHTDQWGCFFFLANREKNERHFIIQHLGNIMRCVVLIMCCGTCIFPYLVYFAYYARQHWGKFIVRANLLGSDPDSNSACVFCVCSTLSEEGSEIFLSPAVMYGPPGLDLSCPITMTIAHCAEVAADNWTIRLKRKMKDNKWEVSNFLLLTLQPQLSGPNFQAEC